MNYYLYLNKWKLKEEEYGLMGWSNIIKCCNKRKRYDFCAGVVYLEKRKVAL